ncbi:MAG: hypothetical protein NT068_01010 [Candidatus Nomurabacteria bacterium]|nr:hypothetical protein [Candidatus Nomurabacteria bacterium]
MKKRSFLNKVGVFFGGIFATKASSYSFDYLLYPLAIHYLGLEWGFVVMLLLSFVLNYLFILLYNSTQRDIFGFEKLKELKDKTTKESKSFIARLVGMGYVMTFIALSFYDPFFAVLWFRKSTKFDKMTKSDWKILTISTIIGNLIWAPMVFGALKIFE